MLSLYNQTYKKDSKGKDSANLAERGAEMVQDKKFAASIRFDSRKPSNLLREPRTPRDSKMNFFNTLPSVQRDSQNFKDYALRQTLNNMEPQMQKFKLRKNLKSIYQKQRESTFVAIMTTSIYGDPRLFDLQQQTHDKAIKGRQSWKSAQHKEMRKAAKDKVDQEAQGDIIHSTILSYLEGFNPNGPSIHTFKLAMLNKKMMIIIKRLYNIRDFQAF